MYRGSSSKHNQSCPSCRSNSYASHDAAHATNDAADHAPVVMEPINSKSTATATINATKTPGLERAPCGWPLHKKNTSPPTTTAFPSHSRELQEARSLDPQLLCHQCIQHLSTPDTSNNGWQTNEHHVSTWISMFCCALPNPSSTPLGKKQSRMLLTKMLLLASSSQSPKECPLCGVYLWQSHPRKMEHPDVPLIYKSSTKPPCVKHITPHHPSTKFPWYPPTQKKTVLDSWNGYHSLPLSPEACDTTTFITEWGEVPLSTCINGISGIRGCIH